MSQTTTRSISPASHRKAIKRAWATYWLANVGLFIILASGSKLAMPAMLLSFGVSVWLAFAVGLGASAAGRTGAVWGIGTVLLGPLGAILLPWAVLNALADKAAP